METELLKSTTGTKVSISTVKRVLYQHNLIGRSARYKPLLKNCHKKSQTTFGLQLHIGTKIVLFWEISSGLMKQKYNCLAIMTTVMVGGKSWRLSSRRNTSQLWSTGVAASCCGLLCYMRDLCTSQNRWLHEDGKLCGYIEATSQDISQEVKAWSQMGLPNGQWPQAYFQSCVKMA